TTGVRMLMSTASGFWVISRRPTGGLVRFSALAAGVLLLVSGCGVFGGSEEQVSSDWCRSQSPQEGCYPPTAGFDVAYCYVKQVRERIADGRLPADDLPDWADRTKHDGVPLVVDLSTIDLDKIA